MKQVAPNLLLKTETIGRVADKLRRASVGLHSRVAQRPAEPHTLTSAGADIEAYLRGVSHAREALSDAAGSALSIAARLMRRSSEVDSELARTLPTGTRPRAQGGPTC